MIIIINSIKESIEKHLSQIFRFLKVIKLIKYNVNHKKVQKDFLKSVKLNQIYSQLAKSVFLYGQT